MEDKKLKETKSYLKTVLENLKVITIEVDDARIFIDLIDKQLPKKPKIINHQLWGDFALCPTCNKYCEISKLKYCGHCGQKLDWSEV